MSCGQESYIIDTSQVSSNLSELTWQHDKQALIVRFKNGSTYRYDGVSPEIAHGLQHAQSYGSYFARFIKGHYTATKIEGPAAVCADCGLPVVARGAVAGKACTASSSGGGCGESILARRLSESLKGGAK